MVNIVKALACWQLVGLFNLLQATDRQEHANRRTQGEKIHWLKIQRVVDHRHLPTELCIRLRVKIH